MAWSEKQYVKLWGLCPSEITHATQLTQLFSFSRYLNFCLESDLDRKITLILKSMTSQPGWQTFAIHRFTNISRSKGNQGIKFDQFIEDNMRNTSLEKSYTKYGRETVPRPSSKKWKFSISLDQYSKVLYILFLFAKLSTIESDWN